MHKNQTVVLYHGKCPDGFGGAFAAWKKFGESADYVPLQRGKPLPEHMDGRDLYFIDFCYDDPSIMEHFREIAHSVTVLDHHETVEEIAKTFPGVFDVSRSAAMIAWQYFHPNTPTPFLFEYIQDYDLYRLDLPDTKAVNAYLTLEPFDFEQWEIMIQKLEDPKQRNELLEHARIYAEHTDKLIRHIAGRADLVEFEGYHVYLSGTVIQAFTDHMGHLLAQEHPPFAILVRPVGDGMHVSLRSNGAVDVAELAERHGGGGHKDAAAFRLAWGDPVPWTPVVPEDHADSRH